MIEKGQIQCIPWWEKGMVREARNLKSFARSGHCEGKHGVGEATGSRSKVELVIRSPPAYAAQNRFHSATVQPCPLSMESSPGTNPFAAAHLYSRWQQQCCSTLSLLEISNESLRDPAYTMQRVGVSKKGKKYIEWYCIFIRNTSILYDYESLNKNEKRFEF